jgi:hypothetical protein
LFERDVVRRLEAAGIGVIVRTRPDLDWEHLELHARALRLERLLDRIG